MKIQQPFLHDEVVVPIRYGSEDHLVYVLQRETSSLSALNGSIKWKCCYSQISLVKEPVVSTTPLSSNMKSDDYIR